MITPLLVLILNGLGKDWSWWEHWSMGIGRLKVGFKALENQVATADEQIGDLLSKHIVEERVEREELAEKVAFYEKELNLNPFSWGKKKKGKK